MSTFGSIARRTISFHCIESLFVSEDPARISYDARLHRRSNLTMGPLEALARIQSEAHLTLHPRGAGSEARAAFGAG